MDIFLLRRIRFTGVEVNPCFFAAESASKNNAA
jgi:hypothetical protein